MSTKPSPSVLPAAKIAELLTAAGERSVSEAEILNDVARGAPPTDDGRMPVLAYIRWLHLEAVSHGH